MKKLILLLIITVTGLSAHAQDFKGSGTGAKPVTIETPKVTPPVYTPDLTTTHEIAIKGVTLMQLNNYLVFEQYGQQIDSSDKLTGAQITAIKKDALTVIQAISKHFADLMAEDRSKWDKEHKAVSK